MSFARQMKRRDRPRSNVKLPRKTGERRVFLGDLLDQASRVSGDLDAWARWFERGYKSPVKTHPIVRLTDDGPDWSRAPQPGDEIGYAMDPYRTDDCLQAALATVTQVPD